MNSSSSPSLQPLPNLDINSAFSDSTPLEDEGFVETVPLIIGDDRKDSQPPESLSQLHLISVTFHLFALLFFFSSVYTVIVPSRTEELAGSSKGSVLGILMSTAAGINIIFCPMIGALSDRTTFRLGKRKPYLILSGAVASAGLLWFPHTTTLVELGLSYVTLGVGINISLPVIQALIPDVVPFHQRGQTAGWSVFFYALGMFGGSVSAGFLLQEVGYDWCSYIITAILLTGVLVTVVLAPDSPSTIGFGLVREKDQQAINDEEIDIVRSNMNVTLLADDKSDQEICLSKEDCATWELLGSLGRFFYSFIEPMLSSSDFGWTWLCTFLFWAGAMTVQEFLQYFLQDAIPHPYHIFGWFELSSAETGMSVWSGFSVCGTVMSSLFSGLLIDKCLGYRIVGFLGTLITCFGVAFVICSSRFELALAGGFIFGTGSGIANGALIGMASNVVSADGRKEGVNNAKYLGIIGNCTNFSQILAMFFGGFLLDYLKKTLHDGNHMAYVVLFSMAIGYLLLCSIAIWKVKSIK